MNKLEAYGYIKEGRLKILNRKRLEADLAAFPDCDVQVTIKKRGKRSNAQNRYYHGVVVHEIRLALRERGTRMDAEQVHEFLKYHFNKQYIHDPVTGEVLSEYGGSTTEFNKTEMGEYITRIAEWASEKLGIVIPEPNQQTELFNTAA